MIKLIYVESSIAKTCELCSWCFLVFRFLERIWDENDKNKKST